MCVIAVNYKNTKMIEDETFEDMFDYNPDGFGMMYVENGALKTYHSMSKVEGRNMYHKIYNEVNATSHIVLHFRIGTSGPNDITNTHPFNVNDNLAFVHNGIIMGYAPTAIKGGKVNPDTRSDTRVFNDSVLSQLENPALDIKNDSVATLIIDIIGTDKLVFLSDENELITYNKDLGVDIDGVWYSNDHFTLYTQRASTRWWAQGQEYDVDGNPVVYADADDDYPDMQSVEVSSDVATDTLSYKCGECGRFHSNEATVYIMIGVSVGATLCENCVSKMTSERILTHARNEDS